MKKKHMAVMAILILTAWAVCGCGKEPVRWTTADKWVAEESTAPTETAEPETEETQPTEPVTEPPRPTVPPPPPTTQPPTEPEPEPELTYIGGILIANKTYPLPSTYNPGVDPTAQAALEEMFAGAAEEGISLWVVSGFRSYDFQKQLYRNYVAMDGQAAADTYSARAGHSEHQTGLAFDLNMASDDFIDTPEAQWLAENCWTYGFIIRYPRGKEEQTGYKYEPWHVRYIGTEQASAVYSSGLCLEEYLDITSVYQ